MFLDDVVSCIRYNRAAAADRLADFAFAIENAMRVAAKPSAGPAPRVERKERTRGHLQVALFAEVHQAFALLIARAIPWLWSSPVPAPVRGSRALDEVAHFLHRLHALRTLIHDF
jgi:hypothetical protein